MDIIKYSYIKKYIGIKKVIVTIDFKTFINIIRVGNIRLN